MRPEVALRAAQSMQQKRRRARGQVLPVYHALNAAEPWLTACGYPIDWDSPRPLGAGDLECLTRACQRVLHPNGEVVDA
jgi:hypothetical protein